MFTYTHIPLNRFGGFIAFEYLRIVRRDFLLCRYYFLSKTNTVVMNQMIRCCDPLVFLGNHQKTLSFSEMGNFDLWQSHNTIFCQPFHLIEGQQYLL